jgi:hypothetical protein
MLRVVSVEPDTSCAACGHPLTKASNAVVVAEPDTDQLVVVCPPEAGRDCPTVATTPSILPCGLPAVVTI